MPSSPDECEVIILFKVDDNLSFGDKREKEERAFATQEWVCFVSDVYAKFTSYAAEVLIH